MNDLKNKRNRFRVKYIPAYIPRIIIPVLRLVYRTRVYVSDGAQRDILCPEGGAVIIANHSNYTDPLIVTDAFWRRRLRYIVGENIVDRKPIRGFLYRQLGCVRINRNTVDFDCIKEAVKLLREGEAMTVFPEGRLYLRAEEIADFKPGAALMAVIAGTPVIPVYITPKKKAFSRVRVMIGAPIDPISICGRFPTAEGLEKLSTELRTIVCDLKAELEEKTK